MLDLLGIDDVTIPDALGAQPIQVESKPFVAVHYHGANYDLTLNQGQSPKVDPPYTTRPVEITSVVDFANRRFSTETATTTAESPRATTSDARPDRVRTMAPL